MTASENPHEPSFFARSFRQLRMRRGAAPRDAVPRTEHFTVTAAERRRRRAMERTRGRLVLAAGFFALMFCVVAVRVAWVSVIAPVAPKIAAEHMPQTANAVLKPITDVVLPGANGRELSKSVLQLRSDLPVLFTTGYTRNAIIHHGRLDPDVRLLPKPYTQRTLAQDVRALLDQGKPSRPSLD